MMTRVRKQGGFTMIELIVGLVVLAILSGGAVAAYTGNRDEATRAPLLQDLDHAVEMFQQREARGEPVATFNELQTAGLTLSDGVVLEQASVEGDRMYMRVRHVKSERRCSVDYSASSPAARNRKQCFGGRGDPAVEEARVGDAAAPSPSDTFTVAVQDPPTVDPQAPDDVFMPLVSDPGDQTGDRAQALSQTFRVTNRGPARRGYLLRAWSSNPRSAGSVSAPARIEVAAGATQNIVVSYRLGTDATADERARIDLEATDEGDPRYAGRGGFETGVRLALAAPSITAPAARSAKPGETFTTEWRVRNNTNAERTLVLTATATGDLEVINGVGLGNAPFYAGEERSVSVTYRVKPGSVAHQTHTATLVATDRASSSHRRSESFTFTTAVDLKAPTLTPPAPLTARPDSVFVLRYRVRNETNEPRELVIVEQSPAQVAVVGRSGAGTVRFGAFEEKTVDISHRIVEPSVRGTVYRPGLRANDRLAGSLAVSADVPVTTGVWLKTPGVASKPADTGLKPDSSVTVSWQIKNESNDARTLVLTPDAGSELSVAGSSGTGRVAFSAYQTRSVSVTYRLAGTSVAGGVREGGLTAADVGSVRSMLRITTLVDERDPTLAAPGARSANPGTSGSAVYTLRNPTNAARSFTFTTASSNTGVAAKPGVPGGVSVPAFGSTPVSMPYVVQAGAAGNASTSLTLTARSNVSRSASASVGLTANAVRQPATLSNPGARQAYKGAADQFSVSITNRSNISENLAPTVSSSNTGVAGSPTVANHNCANVAMGGSCTATLRWSAVKQGSTQLSVRAGSGAAQSAVLAVSVTVPNRAPNKPTLTRTAPSGEVYNGDVVRWSASGSDPDGDALTYTIYCGNGATAAGPTGQCTYSEVKSYSAYVIAKDPYGATAQSGSVPLTVKKKILGCMDARATNYKREATHPDPNEPCRFGVYRAPTLTPLFANEWIEAETGAVRSLTYRLTNNSDFSDNFFGEVSARGINPDPAVQTCTDVYGIPRSGAECTAEREFWRQFWQDACTAYRNGTAPPPPANGSLAPPLGPIACETAGLYDEPVQKPDGTRPQPHTMDRVFAGESTCQNLAKGASCTFTHTWRTNRSSYGLAGYFHDLMAYGQGGGKHESMVARHSTALLLHLPLSAAFSAYPQDGDMCLGGWDVYRAQQQHDEIESIEWYSRINSGQWTHASVSNRYAIPPHRINGSSQHELRLVVRNKQGMVRETSQVLVAQWQSCSGGGGRPRP